MKASARIMNIITDTREQQPLLFPGTFDFKAGTKGREVWTINTRVATLSTGDYSLDGYEDDITIERKATFSELAGNVGHERDRFFREMLRMRDYATAVVLVCEPVDVLANHAYHSAMHPEVLMSNIDVIQERHRVPVRFVLSGDPAQARLEATLYVLECFRRFLRERYREQHGKS